LEHAGQTLASLAASVRAQLSLDSAQIRVAATGGVFRSEILFRRFKLLVEMIDDCICVPAEMSAAAGALLSAYRADGRVVALSDVPALK
jgi:hypothetical protein